MTTLVRRLPATHLKALFQLAKPRVVALIVFCAVIGMALATPELPAPGLLVAATAGIGLTAGAAAMINCLVERTIDARMRRTARQSSSRW